MSIGTKIKQLRRARDITQEQLAEYLGITPRAISQWECERTSPDISQIPLLANYFDVSADILLEIDKAKDETEIKEYFIAYDSLRNKGKASEAFELSVSMYKKHPNDFRVIEQYCWDLFYDPHHMDEPLGEEVHKEELYRLCGRIMDECTEQKIRYSAIDILSTLYLNDGMYEKAKEFCGRFPNSYYGTKDEALEQLYCRSDAKLYAEYMRKNISALTEHVINKMRNYATFACDEPNERISVYEKCISLIKMVYDEGDYGFCHYHLCELYIHIADQYAMMNNFVSAAKNLGMGFEHGKMYDDLSGKMMHTSILVKGNFFDKGEVYCGYEGSFVKQKLDTLQTNKYYDNVRSAAWYNEIVEKYKPFSR